jgi:uncharacterized RDD family membrane protein YckC
MEQKVENLAWKRGVALCYDHMIIAFACVIILLPTILSVSEAIKTPEELFPLLLGSIYTIPAVILILVFMVLYEPYFTYRYGWTLGKKICGLKVVDAEGKNLTFVISFLRFIVKSFCMSIPYANFVIMIICYVRQRKGEKALWDEWIDTNVVLEK